MQLEVWQAVVLGLVEGITEYLPISSTGHLVIASAIMKLDASESKRAIDDFNIIIQGGAILAVVGVYWPSVRSMFMGLFGKDPRGLRLLINLVLAFIPAATVGLLLNDWIDEHLFQLWPVMLALVVGAIYMMVIDLFAAGRIGRLQSGMQEKTIHDITPMQAFLIGCLQCVAMWPGTSRSMMTITGGILAGLRPKHAAEFSFLLGLPTLSAAMVYKLGKNLWHSHKTGEPHVFEQLGWLPCIVGILVAAISAAIAVRWLVAFLNRRGLSPFGWYRMALCLVLIVLVKAGVLSMGGAPAPTIDSRPSDTVPSLDWKEAPGGSPAR